MVEAVNLLEDTLSDRRRGNGTLARVITGPKKPPELVSVRDRREPENGSPNDRATRELCDRFSVESVGSAKILMGSDDSELCERSRLVRAVKSAKVLGRAQILFWCSFPGNEQNVSIANRKNAYIDGLERSKE